VVIFWYKLCKFEYISKKKNHFENKSNILTTLKYGQIFFSHFHFAGMRNRNTRITTLRDKTVHGAKEFIKEMIIHRDTSVIMVQVGSNDLGDKDAGEVIDQYEELIDQIRQSYPDSEVVLGHILPRFYNDHYKTQLSETKRYQFNISLKYLCTDKNLKLVTFENMRKTDYYDRIHLNSEGIKNYVRNLKTVVNPIVNVKTQDTTSTRQSYRQVPQSLVQNFTQPTQNRSYTQPTQNRSYTQPTQNRNFNTRNIENNSFNRYSGNGQNKSFQNRGDRHFYQNQPFQNYRWSDAINNTCPTWTNDNNVYNMLEMLLHNRKLQGFMY